MFVVEIFVISNFGEPPNFPLTRKWINYLCNVLIMRYISMLMNELQLQATWINLSNLILSEKKQDLEENIDYDILFAK